MDIWIYNPLKAHSRLIYVVTTGLFRLGQFEQNSLTPDAEINSETTKSCVQTYDMKRTMLKMVLHVKEMNLFIPFSNSGLKKN